jgi:hypothetical protein
MALMSEHRSYTKGGVTLVILAVAMALILLVSQAANANRVRWFQVNLEHGETEGYSWGVGAKGPKHEPLGQICAQVSMVEPNQGSADVVEGRDATDCGSIGQREDSIAATVSFGSGESRVTVLEVVYRPVVRKVTLVLATGAREVFYPRIPEIPNRAARGIPIFRYFVTPFEGETCVRRIATFDASDNIVSNEVSPPCPPGAGNL